jgi:hypothetical protein
VILITIICVRFQYQDLYYLWCEAFKELLELNTGTQWLGSDGATIVYWRFRKKDGFLRKQVGLFADQVLVRAVGRAFGAWTTAITGTERRVDMLNKGMVQFALLPSSLRQESHTGPLGSSHRVSVSLQKRERSGCTLQSLQAEVGQDD